MPDLNIAAVGNKITNTASAHQSWMIQFYTAQILEQPQIDFSNEKSLVQYQLQISDSPVVMRGRAKHYLQIIQPDLIEKFNAINAYYTQNPCIPSLSLASGTFEEGRVLLENLQRQSALWQTTAEQVIEQLQLLQECLIADLKALTKISSTSTTNLDNFGLETLNSQDYLNSIGQALDAVNAMEEIWNYLSTDLEDLISSLNSAIRVREASIRKHFLESASMSLNDIRQDIRLIKTQRNSWNNACLYLLSQKYL